MKAKTSATSRIEAINDSDYPFSDPKCQPDDIARRDSSLLQGDSAESFFDWFLIKFKWCYDWRRDIERSDFCWHIK